MNTEHGFPIWGDPLPEAVAQMQNAMREADYGALMADHHLGYAVPIGGVVAYEGRVSPSGVGWDIACGNKAVRLGAGATWTVNREIDSLMDRVFSELSFGVGRKNNERVEHELFDDDDAWAIPEVAQLKELSRSQLGTIGSGNHYVDVFKDEYDRVWVGVHFGSRGFGHKLASHYLKEAGGKDGINVDPVVLDADSDIGRRYLAAMRLAGRYAYAGRDWVCRKVADIIGAPIVDEVHNHHNFAWEEEHYGLTLWVVRKGATPLRVGERSFIGGSMGEISVIVKGVAGPGLEESLYSTIHGAGRAMSRTRAAGKRKRRKGQWIQVSEGEISQDMMLDWLRESGVTLRGGGVDESPHCYKRISEVLAHHQSTTNVINTLVPLGVAMAGTDMADPYRD